MVKTLGIVLVSAVAGIILFSVIIVACVPQPEKSNNEIRSELIDKGIIHEPNPELTREERIIVEHYRNMSKDDLDNIAENMKKNAVRVDDPK